MSRDFDPDEHPRWPAGSGDKSGEFRDADVPDAWVAALARSAGRRIPRAESLDELSPDYQPGQWRYISPAMRRERLVEELLPGLMRQTGRTRESLLPFVQEDAQEMVAEDGTYLANGPNLITIRSMKPVDVRMLVDEIDRLMVDYPLSGPLALAVREEEFFRQPGDDPANFTLGETFRVASPKIGLSDRLFPDYTGVGAAHAVTGRYTKMPVAEHVTGVRYVLAHEWGHAFTDSESGVAVANFEEAKRSGQLSGYGQETVWEAIAEAFAEWVLSGGRTQNPVAQQYARNYGWKVPSHVD